MRVPQKVVVVLYVLVVVGTVGCWWDEDRQRPAPESEVQEPPVSGAGADASPAAPDLRSGGVKGEPPPGAAAADVIRTRIAWRKHAEEGVPWPTATPPPPLPVTAAGGVAWSSDIGLMWTESAAGLFEYQDAVALCRGLSIAGYRDWRMPSITELELLLATDFHPPWIDDVPQLWSSTEHDVRGVVTVMLPELTRSRQAVGMAHVVCVRRIQ